MAKIKRKIVKKTAYFAIVDNNLKNFLLSNSSIFYDNDILSENKIEFDILNSYSNKPFLINAFIEIVRFGINNLDIHSN